MNTRKYFGTDGIRGCVGESSINPEFVLKLGWAIGKVLVNGERKKVLIGKDTRVSGYMLESALEAGLSAAGVDIHLLGPMPTPAIAYLTQTLRASAGIVISASHNKFSDNGIKFFSEDGLKLGTEVELAIEAQIEKPLQTVDSFHLGKAIRVHDAPGRYIEFCKSTISFKTKLNGLKIVLDCANGATYHIAPSVFSELGAEVIPVAVKPNGFNINEQCGSTKPQNLQQLVQEHNADLGIAFDGDGDRLAMVDETGALLDGDDILFIIASHYLNVGKKPGGVVGTLLSNQGLELSLKKLGLPFVRAKVGDRYVSELLVSKNWYLGGEPSGHIICRNKLATGDGIVSALQVLAAMRHQGKNLSQLCADRIKLPQVQLNVKTAHSEKLLKNQSVKNAISTIEKKLQQKGRVLLRASGTEPKLRVMVEGESLEKVTEYGQYLVSILEQEKISYLEDYESCKH